MIPDDPHDRLVDLLLRELVGDESPPDVRARVLAAATRWRQVAVHRPKPTLRPAGIHRPARHRAPAIAIAATVAVLGCVGALVHFRNVAAARTPALSAYAGTVSPVGGALGPGRSLTTGSNSTAVLSYPDGSRVTLAANTTLVTARQRPWDAAKGFEVIAGSVDAEIVPQPPQAPLTMTSRHASAEVLGTRLSLRVDKEHTRLEVTDGAVRFLPNTAGNPKIISAGHFAESGDSGFIHGEIDSLPVRGITRFTLMDAETDAPLREEPLTSGETLALSSLPAGGINIRADFEGAPPASVAITLTRRDGADTGLPAHTSADHEHYPFFAAGDYWSEGRPHDCKPWRPRPGYYQLSATAIYAGKSGRIRTNPLEIEFRFSE